MTEAERIQALVEEGRITQEEADELLAVLSDTPDIPENETRSENEARDETETVLPGGGEISNNIPQNGLRGWVSIKLGAGDLKIRVDDSVSEPQIESEMGVAVTRRGQDFEVRGAGRESLLENLLSRLGDVSIRVPTGYGVDIHATSGDVGIDDIPFVKGRLTSGDIELRNVGGVDLSTIGGDLTVSLCLVTGEHRLKATSGDVDITILPGSSVSVTGKATSGDLSLPQNFQQEGRFGSRTFHGTIGTGDAKLSLGLISGDITLGIVCG